MMKSQTLLTCSIVLTMAWSSAFAGPPDHTVGVLTGATVTSAMAAVDRYYSEARIGLSEEDLQFFYTEAKLQDHQAVARILSERTGQDIHIERQRLRDLVNASARCEANEIQDIRISGASHPKARVDYRVMNGCADWLNPTNRSIDLRFSAELERWQIHKIEDSRPYQ